MTGEAPAAPAPVAAAPVAAPAPAAAPSAADPAAWLAGAPEDITAFVQNKGWKDPATAIDSYRQLEKHMGLPPEKLLRLPDFDKAEAADLDAFYGKLGRPGSPDKYDIALAPDAPQAHKDSVAFLKGEFHKQGLSQRQAAAVTEALFQNDAKLKEAGAQARDAAFAQAEETLKRTWGAAYEKNQTVAANAAEAFGLDAADVGVLKSILGAKAMEFLHTVGAKMGEDQFIGAGTNNGFGVMSPVQAREELKRLQTDNEFVTKYLAGNTEARTRMENLQKWAAAGAG